MVEQFSSLSPLDIPTDTRLAIHVGSAVSGVYSSGDGRFSIAPIPVRATDVVAALSRSGSLFTRLHAIVISTDPPSGGRHTNHGRHRSTVSPLGQRICGGQVDAGPLDCAPYRRLAAYSEPTAAHVALTFVWTPAGALLISNETCLQYAQPLGTAMSVARPFRAET